MKKKFDKLNKVMFTAGLIAIITLVLIAINSTNEVIDGIWGTISLLCLLVIFLFVIFAAISVILAIVEGLKKDKKALIKKFLSNVILFMTAYLVPYILDCFYELSLPANFDFGKIVIRVLATTLAFMGGEYMLTDHSKEKQD